MHAVSVVVRGRIASQRGTFAGAACSTRTGKRPVIADSVVRSGSKLQLTAALDVLCSGGGVNGAGNSTVSGAALRKATAVCCRLAHSCLMQLAFVVLRLVEARTLPPDRLRVQFS